LDRADHKQSGGAELPPSPEGLLNYAKYRSFSPPRGRGKPEETTHGLSTKNEKLEENGYGVPTHLPSELIKAMALPEGYTVLIYGPPGTGKTTLGLEILVASHEGVYASTRNTASFLREHFPWLNEGGSLQDLLDPNELEEITRRALAPQGERTSAEGARVESLLRNRFGSLSGLPAIGKAIIRIMASRPSGTLVIDSLDGLRTLDSVESAKLEPVLISAARYTRTKLFLVAEGRSSASLGFLVDGMVRLRDEQMRGRTVRYMDVQKMRGIPRRRPSHVFTLDGARFRVIPVFSYSPPRDMPKRGTPKAEARIPMGHPDLDKLLGGGLEKGSVNVVELGRKVTSTMYEWMLRALASATLCARRPFVLIADPLPSVAKLYEMLVRTFGLGYLSRLLWIILTGYPLGFEGGRDGIITEAKKMQTQDFVREMIRRRKLANVSEMVTVSIETPNFEVRGWQGACVLFLHEEAGIPRGVTNHMCLEKEAGALVLYGVSPSTPAFGVVASAESDAGARLVPLS